ncbi:MAG: FAD-dependent monooxygenase [Hyphomicrobium sp.]|jgi:2-octaprenyl-6-methoxyphenol hydroxylase|nr:FAD-dependent monooxygenase [Hyphomonas sp.]MCU0954922.1 FAD-dependent monooxygenase [Hyphomicrobium sp.]
MSSALPHYDVVISGASVAGLALALALAEAGEGEMRIALLDRTWPPPSAEGDVRAYAVSAASRHMLQVLGAWKGVAPEAQAVRRIEITDSSLDDGIRPVVLTYDNVLEDGEPATHIVPGTLIVSALADRVAGFLAVDRFMPGAIAAYEAAGSGLTVSLADGRVIRTRVLVSAEGRQSGLREKAGIKTVGWSYDQMGIVTWVEHERPHDDTAIQHFLPAGPFAILPLTGNRSCITWSEDADEARRILALDDAAFLAELEKRFGGRWGALKLLSGRQSWPLSMHLARSYVAERIALMGDAAHGVHPIAGQGLNLALRDAAALSEVLIEAARLGLDVGNAEILSRYERWRRFDSAVSTAAFDGLNRLFSSDSAVLRGVRDAGLGLVDRLPAMKQLFVSEAAGMSGELPRLLRGRSI